jgi:hypothetical protein
MIGALAAGVVALSRVPVKVNSFFLAFSYLIVDDSRLTYPH